jgi:hypothetical protein
MPISGTNIAAFVSRNATTIDNDAEDDETGAGQDLDDTKHVLD